MSHHDDTTASAGYGMGSARARCVPCGPFSGSPLAGIDDMNACGRAAARRGDA